MEIYILLSKLIQTMGMIGLMIQIEKRIEIFVINKYLNSRKFY